MDKALVRLLLIAVLAAIALPARAQILAPMMQQQPSGTPQAAAPTFSPPAGSYGSSQSITISTTSGSVICYNTTGSPATNGSTGCTTGTLYTGPVTVSASETLFAVAGGTGFLDSTVASAAYTIGGSTPSILAANCHTLVGTAAASGTCVFTGAVGAGDLIIAYENSFEASCGTTIAVTVDDSINTGNYTSTTVHSDGGNCQQGQYFYFANSVSGTPTLTFCNGSLSGATCSGGTAVSWTLNAVVCHLCATTSPLDAVPVWGPSIGAGVTTVTSPSITTVHSTAVLVSALAETSSGTGVANLGSPISVVSPWAISSTGTSNGVLATQVVTSASTYTGADWSWQFANSPMNSTIAFKGQ